jgi:hypothetical protein
MGERVCAYAELLSFGADEMVLGNLKANLQMGMSWGEQRGAEPDGCLGCSAQAQFRCKKILQKNSRFLVTSNL